MSEKRIIPGLYDELQPLAEQHGLFIHDYDEGGLDVVELHSTAVKKGPGSERFVRITGFPITVMVSMLCAALRAKAGRP